MSGDTASFGLRWLSLTEPKAAPCEVADAPLTDARAWLAARVGRRDVFMTGLGRAEMRALGVPSAFHPLSPEGLAQRLDARPPTAPSLSVLRRPRAWAGEDSYVHGVRLSYAYASWLSARLLEEQGTPASETLDLAAVALDPEDYHLQ